MRFSLDHYKKKKQEQKKSECNLKLILSHSFIPLSNTCRCLCSDSLRRYFQFAEDFFAFSEDRLKANAATLPRGGAEVVEGYFAAVK